MSVNSVVSYVRAYVQNNFKSIGWQFMIRNVSKIGIESARKYELFFIEILYNNKINFKHKSLFLMWLML